MNRASRARCALQKKSLIESLEPRRLLSGYVDSTFGTAGQVSIPAWDGGGIAVQPDDKILAVSTSGVQISSDIQLTRRNPDGSPDSTFGVGGKEIVDVAAQDQGISVAVEPDGKIIVVGLIAGPGTFQTDVLRFNSNGSLDTSFGNHGVTTLTFAPYNVMGSIAVRGGKIFLGGQAGPNDQSLFGALTCLDSNGQIDPTFGTGGTVFHTDPHFPDMIAGGFAGMVLDSAGRIVTASADPDGVLNDNGVTVTRYTPSGQLDSSFGISGSVTVPTIYSSVDALAITANDSITVLTELGILTSTKPLKIQGSLKLIRLTSGGALDPSFGTGGIQPSPIPMVDPLMRIGSAQLLRDSSGKVLAAGTERTNTGAMAAFVARFNANGSPDSTLGSGGQIAISAPPNIVNSVAGLAIQSDGKLLLAIGSSAEQITRIDPSAIAPALSPSVNAAGPYSFPEGTLRAPQLAGTANSGDPATVLINSEWDLNYDGVNFNSDLTGLTPSLPNLDGPSSTVIALRVTDGFGRTAISTSSLTLSNVAPTATFSATSANVFAGTGSYVGFSNVSDPSNADVSAGFTYSFDLNNDGVWDVVNSPQPLCPVPGSVLTSAGIYTVKGQITDKDGASTVYSTLVHVIPAAASSINGTVFFDANGNGTREMEGGMQYVVMYLDVNGDGLQQTTEPTATTDSYGNYTFANCLPGDYAVRISSQGMPPGDRLTSPSANGVPVTVVGTQAVVGADFGLTTALRATLPFVSLLEGGSVTIVPNVTPSPGTTISYEWDLHYDSQNFVVRATTPTVTIDSSTIARGHGVVVALRVTDSAGEVTPITTTFVHPGNAAPTAQLSASEVTLGAAGMMSFSNAFDTSPIDMAAGFRYSFDFNNDQQFEIVDSTTPTATVPASYLTTPGIHFVRGRIKDSLGAFTDYVVPAVVHPPAPASIGGILFVDANGDGQPQQAEAALARKTVFLDSNGNAQLDSGEPTDVSDSAGVFYFANVPPGNYSVCAQLAAGWTQSDPSYTISSSTVVSGADVAAQPPLAASISALSSVAEGASIPLDASASAEPGGSLVKYEWDTNYNGTTFVARATGVTTSFSAGSIDGPATRTVALRVTDAFGATAIATAKISIINVPPTAKFAAASPSVTLGAADSVTFSAQSDPSPADVSSGFKYSYDFNNDGKFEITDSSSASASVPAAYLATAGIHTIHGRIKDKDGGFTDYTTTITVTAPKLASISGEVFADNNGNAKLDAGELGVSGRKIYIDKNKNGVLDAGEPTFTTGANGAFTFNGLAAGTYRVRDVLPLGWRRTSPTSGYFDVTVSAGQVVTGKNFAETTRGLISGIVFKDANGNGIKDSTEIALSGWVIFLDTNNNGKLDAGELSFTTGSDGKFSFVVPAGTYHLREVLKSGFKRTAPSAGVYTITLGSGQSSTGKNFGDR